MKHSSIQNSSGSGNDGHASGTTATTVPQSPTDIITPRNRNNVTKNIIQTRLQILSATYGPSEGRRLLDGTLVDYSKKESYVPYTRNVLPFVKALMNISGDECDDEENDSHFDESYDDDFLRDDFDDEGVSGEDENDYQKVGSNIHSCPLQNNDIHHPTFGENLLHRSKRQRQHRRSKFRKHSNKNAFPLMDGRSMNAVFGDPCPGTTKLLKVEYLFRDYFYWDVEGFDCNVDVDIVDVGDDNGISHSFDDTHDATILNGSNCTTIANIAIAAGVKITAKETNGTILREHQTRKGRRRRSCHCATSRTYHSTFAEHERVLLRRQDPLFRLATDHNADIIDAEVRQHQQQSCEDNPDVCMNVMN